MALPTRALSAHPNRFRLARAGIHQVWQYDDVFAFGDGRLLLRGKNGAGKSKALEILLPYLLDGDTRRIDASGGGKTSLKWLMLDGWNQGTNRQGYLWAEFTRVDDEGTPRQLTVGAAIRASVSTGEAKAEFFVTTLKVGDELPLHDPSRRPTREKARELIGHDNWYERAADYKARVARELFGLTDIARYRNLVHLLYGLRRPTIGDRIESGELVKVLSDALPPLDDDVIDKVARNLDDLDSVRAELARLEKTNNALAAFLRNYRRYLHGVLRARVGQVTDALRDLSNKRRQAGDAERLVASLKEQESAADAVAEELQKTRDNADADLRALRESAAYGAVRDLHDKRETLRAIADNAGIAWVSAGLARDGESTAAKHLRDDTASIARELSDLHGVLRKARKAARGCGVDEALLAEVPTARTEVLSSPIPEHLTSPDGAGVDVMRPAAESMAGDIAGELAEWRTQITDSDSVVKGRLRAAAALDDRLREVTAAEVKAAGLREQADRLDGQRDEAEKRSRQRGDDLVRESERYAGEIRSWAGRLPDPPAATAAVEIPGDPGLPTTERALGRDVPEAVARAAHEVADPVLGEYERQRDDIREREAQIGRDLRSAQDEKQKWERQTDPEPPRSRYSSADRTPGTGAPLFLLVDFRESVPETDRAGLEAGLEASGLLAAWATADGVLLAGETRDVILRDAGPVTGPSLADILTPVPGHGVSEATLGRLLRGIGLAAGGGAEPTARTWVARDGRYRLDVIRGAHAKDRAEYIGAAVRAATRQRRVEELTERIGELEGRLEDEVAARKRIERLREALRDALREIPKSRGLTDAWTGYDHAMTEVARLSAELLTARRKAEAATAGAVSLRTRAEAQATSDGLPADRDQLAVLRQELSGLRKDLEAIAAGTGRVLVRLETHAGARASWTDARQARVDADAGYQTAYGKLTSAQREIERLEESVGATEREILAKEADAQGRLDDADRRLPHARTTARDARDGKVKAEGKRDDLVRELARQEQATAAGGSALRRPLGLPGLPLAAGLDGVDALLDRYDAARDGDVRARIAALKALADDVGAMLGPERADVSPSAIIRRSEELRDGLAGGYDAEGTEEDGIKRYVLRDDTGPHDIAVVGASISSAAEAARNRLSAREQEVFETYLLGELGDHLSRQVLAARNLVDGMNDTLEQVRSSHGIGVRLEWELPRDGNADARAAVALLRQPSALRTRDQSAQLRDALRRRIEEARLSDPSAGYAIHLRAALDYREWFDFRVKVTDQAHPDRERLLGRRTALSQGEMRVVAYLVLFATAAAHFTSVAASAPRAPRLILLDDAFAKVDEPTHGRLLGLLVELDLDFIITSERLWGCFPTVPSLHIYECLRDPAVRGVATVHFTWDGRHKHLVGI
jgi:uncharacterized protein (TIGR02680 family)